MSEFIVLRDGASLDGELLFEERALTEYLAARGALIIGPSGVISITFVGFAVWKSRVIVFLPKELPAPDVRDKAALQAAVRLILRVLRRYARDAWINDADARRLSRSLTDPETSGLALATWLASDFASHGLYRRLQNRFGSSGPGVIDWHRTISGRVAHISDGGAVYLDYVTRDKSRDDSLFVTRLHLAVLEQCVHRYGWLIDLDRHQLDAERVSPIEEGPLFALGPVYLAKELRHAYAERTIQLFRVLDAFLRSKQPTSSTTFEIYGTSYFSRVWEEMCGAIIGNNLNTWSDCIPNPIWCSESGERQKAATLRPDIVRQFEHDGKNAVLLIDAKYYSLNMPPLLSGHPGSGDVIKQLVYELAIEKEAARRGVVFAGNVFVFPGDLKTRSFAIGGDVSFSGVGAGPIGVVYMDVDRAMVGYANGQSIPELEMAASLRAFWRTGRAGAG